MRLNVRSATGHGARTLGSAPLHSYVHCTYCPLPHNHSHWPGAQQWCGSPRILPRPSLGLLRKASWSEEGHWIKESLWDFNSYVLNKGLCTHDWRLDWLSTTTFDLRLVAIIINEADKSSASYQEFLYWNEWRNVRGILNGHFHGEFPGEPPRIYYRSNLDHFTRNLLVFHWFPKQNRKCSRETSNPIRKCQHSIKAHKSSLLFILALHLYISLLK